jgi:DNA-binding PadR family transcriptional regulator
MERHKSEVMPGTLNLMVLKTLSALGPLQGYGIARRIEQISGNLLQLNQGTIWRAKYYSIIRTGKKQLASEEENWRRASEIMIRFLEPSEGNI